jgi:trehalose-6-phosphatase
MAQEKIIIRETAEGTFNAMVYDGKMRIFLKQNIESKKAALKAVNQFLKEQEEKIETGELLTLE